MNITNEFRRHPLVKPKIPDRIEDLSPIPSKNRKGFHGEN